MIEKQQDNVLALIARNLGGLTNSSEESELNEWIERSESNRKYFEQLRNIWNESGKQIDPRKIDSRKALNKVLDKLHEPSVIIKFWHSWQKIAAILIIPLAIGTLLLIYLNYDKKVKSEQVVFNEVFAAFGTRSALRLADSTLVWLNSGSSLKFPDKFIGTTREVFLKGEAYFEVKSDVSRQFIVNTSSLQVKATGTKFNVMDYNKGPTTEVTLVSGNVFVSTPLNEGGQHLISELNPGQHLIYESKTGAKSIIDGDTYRYFSWKDGKLIFRNETLSDVVKKLSQVFNVEIELQGNDLQNYRYRATFEDESFEEILKLLKLSCPINYRELKRSPLPDGSFTKKKVVIYALNNSIN